MQITISTPSLKQILLIACAALLLVVLATPQTIRAQRPAPAVAQVGPASPLPVYVINETPPPLPDGFVPGSSWKFTTWTIPSTLTFSARVETVSGGWAYLTVQTNADTKPRWYYIPQMPGTWEPL
jgi:hypothetical protein